MVATLSLVVAVLAFLVSVATARRQRQEWHEINRPRLRLSEPFLLAFGEYQSDEVHTIDWGYDDPLIFIVSDDRMVTDRFRLHTELVIWRPDGGRVGGVSAAPTLAKAQQELDRRGLPRGVFILRKHIQVSFGLENIGNTPASEVGVDIRLRDDAEEVNVFKSQPQGWIDKGDRRHFPANFYFPLDWPIPRFMNFAVDVEYGGPTGTEYKSTFRISLDTDQSRWLQIDGADWPSVRIGPTAESN